MADQLRFGFIGCGEIAAQTARAVAETDNSTLTWVMDSNPALAADLGNTYQARHTTDAGELVAQPDIDVVYIAIPHFLHLPMAIKAIRAGKHILLEKPTGTHSGESAAIIRAAREAGVKMGVAFELRYAPAVTKARELIQAGVLGKIFGTRVVTLADKPESYWQGGYSGRSKSDWRIYKARAGGGVLIMNCIHNLDVMRYLTGLETERAYSEYGTYDTQVEVEDFITVTLRYMGGATGSIEAGSAIAGRNEYEQWRGDRIYGTEGQIVFNANNFRNLNVYTRNSDAGIEPGKWHTFELPQTIQTRTAMVEDFTRAILDDRTPPITGEDALAVLATITAAYNACELGRAVYISEVIEPISINDI